MKERDGYLQASASNCETEGAILDLRQPSFISKLKERSLCNSVNCQTSYKYKFTRGFNATTLIEMEKKLATPAYHKTSIIHILHGRSSSCALVKGKTVVTHAGTEFDSERSYESETLEKTGS